MSGASTVPTVLARLLVLFKEATDPSITEVWGNRPNETHQLAENVYIGDVAGSREFKTIGQGRTPFQREENYSVSVEVEVYRDGTDIEGTEERMWELTALLEAAIGQDVRLGLTEGIQWVIVDRFRSSSQATDEGCRSTNVFEVDVKARI